ncbi:hypothetical protein [Mammaliicoccus sciuri]|uniref:hypothetical protein n=1 Tax=Mammaliicoccus sciuri TaxID=1296 RepID=UPI0034DCEB25
MSPSKFTSIKAFVLIFPILLFEASVCVLFVIPFDEDSSFDVSTFSAVFFTDSSSLVLLSEGTSFSESLFASMSSFVASSSDVSSESVALSSSTSDVVSSTFSLFSEGRSLFD